MRKYLYRLCLVLFATFVLGVLSWYVVFISGLFPNYQELWVTTAMTTYSHKWLATAFISRDTVDDIMERTLVHDEDYVTNPTLIVPTIAPDYMLDTITQHKDEIQIPIDTYVEDEGYTKLEDGIYKRQVSGTTWKGHLILITDPARVSLTDTKYQYNKGQTVKDMVADSGAILGVNAGGFDDGPNYDSNGGIPAGLLIVNGEIISPKNTNSTYKYSVIGFNQDNVLVLGKMTIKEALEAGIRDSIHFKPFLIVNGETVIKEGNGGWGIAPRTAIGQRATGEVLFLVIDGRQPTHSIGVDLRVLQDTLFDSTYGKAINAAMCDGGSSTVAVYNGEFINKPSLGHERWINNCWVVH